MKKQIKGEKVFHVSATKTPKDTKIILYLLMYTFESSSKKDAKTLKIIFSTHLKQSTKSLPNK